MSQDLLSLPPAEAFATVTGLIDDYDPARSEAGLAEALNGYSVGELSHLTAGIRPNHQDATAGRAVAALFRRWAETAPEEALPFIPPLGLRPGIEAATALAERLATLDPAAAVAWVQKLSDSPPVNERGEDMFTEQLRKSGMRDAFHPNPFSSIMCRLMGDGNAVKNRAWDILIETLARTDIAAAGDACLRAVTGSGYASTNGADAIARKLGLTDPQAGYAFVSSLPAGSAAMDAGYQALAHSWATVDLPAAKKWLEAWEDEPRNLAVATIMESLPDHCIELWTMLSDEALENEGLWYAVIRSFAANGAAGAADKLEQLPSEERGGRILWEIFHRVAEQDPEGVRAQLDRSLPADLLSGIASGLAFAISSKSPQEAAALLEKYGASEQYPVTCAAESLAEVDLPAALAFLASQPEEMVTFGYERAWQGAAKIDPGAALRTALVQSDPEHREKGCRAVLSKWAEADQEDAVAFILTCDPALQPDLMAWLLDHWVWRFPQKSGRALAAFLQTNPVIAPDDTRWPGLAAKIAREWFDHQPVEARAWAAALPDGSMKSVAVDEILKRIGDEGATPAAPPEKS